MRMTIPSSACDGCVAFQGSGINEILNGGANVTEMLFTGCPLLHVSEQAGIVRREFAPMVSHGDRYPVTAEGGDDGYEGIVTVETERPL
jgi:hypothetical protein